ncbi:MAG: hypothetical protein V9G10_12260 [Candidatus Nanopelagicales bacterium]
MFSGLASRTCASAGTTSCRSAVWADRSTASVSAVTTQRRAAVFEAADHGFLVLDAQGIPLRQCHTDPAQRHVRTAPQPVRLGVAGPHRLREAWIVDGEVRGAVDLPHEIAAGSRREAALPPPDGQGRLGGGDQMPGGRHSGHAVVGTDLQEDVPAADLLAQPVLTEGRQFGQSFRLHPAQTQTRQQARPDPPGRRQPGRRGEQIGVRRLRERRGHQVGPGAKHRLDLGRALGPQIQRDEFGPGLRRCGDPGLVFAVERLGLRGGVLVLLGPQDPAAHSHRSASQRTAG